MDYRRRRQLAVALLAVCASQLIVADEVTILDTRNATSDLGWPTSGYGWTEVTGHDENDADLRTFQVCRIQRRNQNNWLRTSYLQVGDARRLYVEIRFTIRSCEGIHRKSIASCKETFNLYYLEADDKNDERASQMNSETYTKLNTIAADHRFEENTIFSNTETRIISPVSSSGIFIAFQDTGACMTIMHVRVYYKTCAPTVRNLASFPLTSTGPEVTSLVNVRGQCVDGAVSDKGPDPTLHCNAEGRWLVPAGQCRCRRGRQPTSRSPTSAQPAACEECPVGTFKHETGNQACASCPAHTHATARRGSTACSCDQGFFRTVLDRLDQPCTTTPDGPAFAESSVNRSVVTLTWKEPSDKGGRDDVVYSLTCEECDATYAECVRCKGRVVFAPGHRALTATRVVVHGLRSHTNYKFKIFATNGVSHLSSEQRRFTTVTVKTNEAAPAAVTNIQVMLVTARGALLRWDSPASTSGPVFDYEVRYNSGARQQQLVNITAEKSLKLLDLQPATSYTFTVRARSEAGYGPFSRPTAFRTQPDRVTAFPITYDKTSRGENDNDKVAAPVTTNDESTGERLVVAIAVTCSLLVVMLGLLLVLCARRRKYARKRSLGGAVDVVEKYPGFINGSVDLMSSRTYVDPSTYEDPYIALQEFAKEIDYSLVSIERVIGSGEFGEVCQGALAPSNKVVAIKTLKAGYSNQEKSNFLGEAAIMGQFDHPNVIRLEGVVTRTRPLMIITEFMRNGSLDTFLRANERKLGVSQLARILYEVAAGMSYLADMGYVHRDLAARNILVNAELSCKVSDFGLSRVLEEVRDEEVAMYTTRGGMIPIRWTALEAITRRTFTSASDVWSFGIVMWEVLSFGERPYWEMSNQDVVHMVESGYRLPPPCHCPAVLHALMLECWNGERLQRPTFTQLVNLLGRFVQEPDLLEDTLNRRTAREQEDCIPDILDISSLGQWLEQMRLLQFKPVMLRHGCITAEQIMRLSASELERMGISSPNHVNTILTEALVLRHKIEEVNHNGVPV